MAAPTPPGSDQPGKSPEQQNGSRKSATTLHIERLVVWGGCSVLLALFPPMLAGLKAAVLSSAPNGDAVSRTTVFLRAASDGGELLLLAGALSAAMIGEMIGVEYRPVRIFKVLVVVLCLLIFAGSAYLFPYAKELSSRNEWTSALFLAASIVIAGAGILVSSIDRESNA